MNWKVIIQQIYDDFGTISVHDTEFDDVDTNFEHAVFHDSAILFHSEDKCSIHIHDYLRPFLSRWRDFEHVFTSCFSPLHQCTPLCPRRRRLFYLLLTCVFVPSFITTTKNKSSTAHTIFFACLNSSDTEISTIKDYFTLCFRGYS